MPDRPEIQPYLAAVVQAPILAVRDSASARETMRRNAERVAATIDAIMTTTYPRPRLVVFSVLCLTGASRGASGVGIDDVVVELPGKDFEPILAACARHDC